MSPNCSPNKSSHNTQEQIAGRGQSKAAVEVGTQICFGSCTGAQRTAISCRIGAYRGNTDSRETIGEYPRVAIEISPVVRCWCSRRAGSVRDSRSSTTEPAGGAREHRPNTTPHRCDPRGNRFGPGSTARPNDGGRRDRWGRGRGASPGGRDVGHGGALRGCDQQGFGC